MFNMPWTHHSKVWYFYNTLWASFSHKMYFHICLLFVISVTTKLHVKETWRDIRCQLMKASKINVLKLQVKLTSMHIKCQFLKVIKYECNKCDYKDILIGQIKRHKISVHEGINDECGFCDYKANLSCFDTLQWNHCNIHSMSTYVKKMF